MFLTKSVKSLSSKSAARISQTLEASLDHPKTRLDSKKRMTWRPKDAVSRNSDSLDDYFSSRDCLNSHDQAAFNFLEDENYAYLVCIVRRVLQTTHLFWRLGHDAQNTWKKADP